MRCALIYNPISGRNPQRRTEQLRPVVEALTQRGHQAELISTTASGSATILTQAEANSGAEIIFACGGDGTIHEVLQALVSEIGEPKSALGIIPLGTANALARHLRLSLDPVRAVLQQIDAVPQTIPAGKLQFGDQTRYFTVMAGAGPDGALVYGLLRSQKSSAKKSSLGRMAYYLHAARLFATRRFRPFTVDAVLTEPGAILSHRAVSAMTVRVGNLGGPFSRLVGRGADLDDPYLTLFLLKPPAVLSLPLWFLSAWLHLPRINPFLTTARVSQFTFLPIVGKAPYFQADGESLGQIPIEVSLVPNALRILLPPTHRPS